MLPEPRKRARPDIVFHGTPVVSWRTTMWLLVAGAILMILISPGYAIGFLLAWMIALTIRYAYRRSQQ